MPCMPVAGEAGNWITWNLFFLIRAAACEAHIPPAKNLFSCYYRGIMSFPHLYQVELKKAIDSIDLDKVSQAVRMLAEAREQRRRFSFAATAAAPAPCRIPPPAW